VFFFKGFINTKFFSENTNSSAKENLIISFSFTVLIKVRRKKKSGDPTLNYSLIILLTALEMGQGEFPRWRAGSDVEVRKNAYCSKIRVSRFICEPLPKMPFLTAPMTRRIRLKE
jgi:hypothetical protein